jgi:DnaJ-class molecular chaperone
MKDPYQILGISRHAEIDEIKRTFRRLARQIHPDSDPGNPRAEANFRELAAAYEVLSDPGKRARYDRSEIDAGGRPRRGARRTDQERGKESSNDRSRRRSDRNDTGFRVKGADVVYSLTVSAREAATGITKHINTTTGKRLAVKVPPGAFEGQILRLKGEGMGGMGGHAAGDALVEVQVEAHPLFDRKGDDIRVEVEVTLAEAVLGGRIETPTIDGAAMVTIPAGSNSGTVLRLRGKGMARADGGCGDQYISLKVVLPPNPDTEFVHFVKRWSERHPYRVRCGQAK